MTIFELINELDEKLAKKAQINKLVFQIADDKKIIKHLDREIWVQLKKINNAAEAASIWLKTVDHKTIAKDISDWQKHLLDINIMDCQPHQINRLSKDLDRITEKIKSLWQNYTGQKLMSISELASFLIQSNLLSSDEQKALMDHHAELSRTEKGFPGKGTVQSFHRDFEVVNQMIINFIPDRAVQRFISKAQAGNATGLDLSPEVLDWFKQREGLGQLKITIGESSS